jgi:hypothetical protein
MSVVENSHMEKIIDQRIGKKIKRRTYFEYLFKWKGHLREDSSWVNEADIKNYGYLVQEIMDRSQ